MLVIGKRWDFDSAKCGINKNADFVYPSNYISKTYPASFLRPKSKIQQLLPPSQITGYNVFNIHVNSKSTDCPTKNQFDYLNAVAVSLSNYRVQCNYYFNSESIDCPTKNQTFFMFLETSP